MWKRKFSYSVLPIPGLWIWDCALASRYKGEIWELRAKLGLFWDQNLGLEQFTWQLIDWTKASYTELWIAGWNETFKKLNEFTPGLGLLCNALQCLKWSTVCLLSQDWVWVNTFAARNYKFTPGDIVVYVSPKDSTDCLIKRVIGVEGDIISSDRCVLSS